MADTIEFMPRKPINASWWWLPLFIVSLTLNTFFFIQPFQKDAFSNENNSPDEFPYLAKRLEVENNNDFLISFVPLRQAMNKYVDESANFIQIYFEYLPSGSSINIHNDYEFPIASLLKVPLAISVYGRVSRGELSENQVLTIEENHIDERFGSLWQEGVGATLTIEEAIRYSLQQSDNTATQILASLISEDNRLDLFNELEIHEQQAHGQYIPVMNAKSYSSVFKALYLSSVLPQNYSDKILSLLTQTEFKNQIPAGVNPSIPIAHKIGIYDVDLPNGNIAQYYSDCGIVYYPQRPYLICAIVEGNNEIANKHISYLSKMAFSYIEKVKMNTALE